jgi:hypothetical protein
MKYTFHAKADGDFALHFGEGFAYSAFMLHCAA